MNTIYFRKTLLQWYAHHRRDLPWRETTDPYKIWLSEIILQQTRVQQGLPYYLSFEKKYPTVIDFANASEDQILKTWQGLGYYSRARNMHHTAQLIRDTHQGVFPGDYDGLLKLKGVGPYTAAAIASFAYKQPVALVDGNVFRVLARLFGMSENIALPKNHTLFKNKAQELLDPKQPDLFNQAIMEFGATHCTPQNPNCTTCPFANDCFAHQHQLTQSLPYKQKSVPKMIRYFQFWVFFCDNEYFFVQRTEQDIWKGLYTFFTTEDIDYQNNKTIPAILQSWVTEKPTLISKDVKHILTHRILYADFLYVEIKKEDKKELKKQLNGQWVKRKDITQLALPVLMSKGLNALNI
jgi:A/G-specific adenine glycosylase